MSLMARKTAAKRCLRDIICSQVLCKPRPKQRCFAGDLHSCDLSHPAERNSWLAGEIEAQYLRCVNESILEFRIALDEMLTQIVCIFYIFE